MAVILVLVWTLIFGGSVGLSRSQNERFKESLWVKSLPSGHIHTYMEFLLTDDAGTHNANHSSLFPRALLEILNAHDVYELQYSLTQGYWRLGSWGESGTSAPTGAQVSAWFGSEREEYVANIYQ